MLKLLCARKPLLQTPATEALSRSACASSLGTCSQSLRRAETDAAKASYQSPWPPGCILPAATAGRGVGPSASFGLRLRFVVVFHLLLGLLKSSIVAHMPQDSPHTTAGARLYVLLVHLYHVVAITFMSDGSGSNVCMSADPRPLERDTEVRCVVVQITIAHTLPHHVVVPGSRKPCHVTLACRGWTCVRSSMPRCDGSRFRVRRRDCLIRVSSAVGGVLSRGGRHGWTFGHPLERKWLSNPLERKWLLEPRVCRRAGLRVTQE